VQGKTARCTEQRRTRANFMFVAGEVEMSEHLSKKS
jgi:hypothetical protein